MRRRPTEDIKNEIVNNVKGCDKNMVLCSIYGLEKSETGENIDKLLNEFINSPSISMAKLHVETDNEFTNLGTPLIDIEKKYATCFQNFYQVNPTEEQVLLAKRRSLEEKSNKLKKENANSNYISEFGDKITQKDITNYLAKHQLDIDDQDSIYKFKQWVKKKYLNTTSGKKTTS